MTKDKAARLVAKLEALADPARGGTPSERRLAGAKARALRERFGLKSTPRPGPIQPPRAPKPRRPAYTAPVRGPAWDFDIATGRASPNVKVHHYRDRANWKIEVPL